MIDFDFTKYKKTKYKFLKSNFLDTLIYNSDSINTENRYSATNPNFLSKKLKKEVTSMPIDSN